MELLGKLQQKLNLEIQFLTLATLQELLSHGWVTATVLGRAETEPSFPYREFYWLVLPTAFTVPTLVPATDTSCLDECHGLLVDLASSVFTTWQPERSFESISDHAVPLLRVVQRTPCMALGGGAKTSER